jgi:hypothetical protein
LPKGATGLEAQLLKFDAVKTLIKLGDFRGKNAERLVQATGALVLA